MIGGDEKSLLFFYIGERIGERPWNAARQLSELVKVDERFKSYFHDYKMNLIEITGNTSYNFNEEDVYNLFYICRSIYDQSIYEEKNNSFGLVKSSVLKVVKTLTDVEWLDLEELEEKEDIEMCGQETSNNYVVDTDAREKNGNVGEDRKSTRLNSSHRN